MINDIEAFMKMYPGWFDAPITPSDIITWVFVFILPFLAPYLYIKYFESGVISIVRNRMVPFVRFRLHSEKLIVVIKRMLEIQILRPPKARL